MLKLDVIEHIRLAWKIPLVVVPKSEDRVWLCFDSRKLNSVTVRDAFVIPNLNRILGRLRATKYIQTNGQFLANWSRRVIKSKDS
jgi:hypothetical protein